MNEKYYRNWDDFCEAIRNVVSCPWAIRELLISNVVVGNLTDLSAINIARTIGKKVN